MLAIEQFAPLGLQDDFDNSGLLVGHADAEVGSALICVDITEAVMDEARRLGAGMVISHHPIIFHPLRHITGGSYVERVVEQAIKEEIALYAAHTNLDNAGGGMSFRLASMLGLEDVSVLVPSAQDAATGSGVVGRLPAPMPAEAFLKHVKNVLGLKVIRHSEICIANIEKVALCTGSGAFLTDAAAAAGAGILVTADLKYNNFLDTGGRLIVADIGHFESEYCAIDLMYDIIRKKMPTFALHKSVDSRNPVNYIV